jgi:HEPN domain-containing protein
MKKSAGEWVRKAEGDFVAVRKLARGSEPAHDSTCFHCQQGAEKYLKAILEELGLRVPRTHNLVALLVLVLPHHGSLRRFRRGLDFLTRFAVDTRYPGDDATKRQAASAERWAGQVRGACPRLLGLPVSPTHRRRAP